MLGCIKKNDGLISVIIPCFNQDKYLGYAIKSVIEQTYEKWECLIVDDGSTDDSKKVAQRYVKLDCRIKYFRRKKEGVSSARNYGLDVARGEFIQFLDADDLLQRDKLSVGAEILQKRNNVDAVVFDARYFESDQPDKLKYNLFDNKEWMESAWAENKNILPKLLDRNLMPVNSPILRRAIIDKSGYFDESLSFCEDWEFWIRCVATPAHFYFLSCPNTFALVRNHVGSISRNRRQMFHGEYRIILKSAKLLKKDKSLYNQCYNVAISRLRKNLKNWSPLDIIKLANTFGIKKIYRILPQIFCERYQIIRKLLHPGKTKLVTELYYVDKKICQNYLDKKVEINRSIKYHKLSEEKFLIYLLDFIKTNRYASSALKPFSGFHPKIYAEKNNVVPSDAVLNYLAEDCPEGPWKHKVINLQTSQSSDDSTLRSALHIHMHYLDDLQEIYDRLNGVMYPLDVFISITEESNKEEVSRIFAHYRHGKVSIKKFLNKGRNIGPFISGFSQDFMDYDIIGHVHVKKSTNVKDRSFLNNWKEWLYNNILGVDSGMINKIINNFLTDEKTGIIFPDDRIIYGWEKNKSSAMQLAKRLNLDSNLLNTESLIFPVGAMFWVRRKAIQPLFDLTLSWSEYPTEPIPSDGTILHVLERIIPLIVTSGGYDIVLTDVDFYLRKHPSI